MNYRAQFTCMVLLSMTSSAFAAPQHLPKMPEGRTLYPYVFGGMTYDSNVFRVANKREARAQTGSGQMDDFISHYGVGVRVKKPISLQTIRLNAAIERVDYNHFDSLDHPAGNALAAWDWEIGRLFDGTLSHSYVRDISDFNEFRQPVKDTRDVNVTHFDGGYNILPAWRLVAGIEHRNVDYDRQNFLDRDELTGFGEVQYATTANSHVGVRARHTDADLNRSSVVTGSPTDNDYRENEYSLVVGWQGTSKSYLEGHAGYTKRNQDGAGQSDFGGFTARLLYAWRITPITSLKTSVYRDVNALDYQISTFVISNGVSLQPAVQITPDTRIEGRVAYEQDEFKGPVRDTTGVLISDRGREDDLTSARLGVNYTAITDLNLGLAVEYGDRNSNRSDSDYTYTQVLTEISYGF